MKILTTIITTLLLTQGNIMAKDVNVETSHEFKLRATAVWNLIAGFNTLPDYHASVPRKSIESRWCRSLSHHFRRSWRWALWSSDW